MRIIILHVGLRGSVFATVTRYVSQGIQWGAALERHSRIVVLLVVEAVYAKTIHLFACDANDSTFVRRSRCQ
jgi:hypothetical protein